MIDKIRVVSFVSFVFSRASHRRAIPFSEVAAACVVPLSAVELLVLQTFALGLVSGHIDEVAQTVLVESVRPKPVSLYYVKKMQEKVQHWREHAEDAGNFFDAQVAQTSQ